MRRITSFEIQTLKGLLKIYRDENAHLRVENDELRDKTAETRAYLRGYLEGRDDAKREMQRELIRDGIVDLGDGFWASTTSYHKEEE